MLAMVANDDVGHLNERGALGCMASVWLVELRLERA
jgi:hypothetical protein